MINAQGSPFNHGVSWYYSGVARIYPESESGGNDLYGWTLELIGRKM